MEQETKIILENSFNSFFNKKNDTIKYYKDLVLKKEYNFIQSISYNEKNIKVLLSFIHACMRCFNRIQLVKNINNDFNDTLEAHELSRTISMWEHCKKKSKIIYDDLLYPTNIVYHSPHRDMIENNKIHIEKSLQNKEFTVLSNNIGTDEMTEDYIDSSGVLIKDELENIYSMIKENNYNYFKVDNDTILYFPKEFVFMIDDKIYIKHRQSFFYKDVSRTYIGNHYDTVNPKILNNWINVFNKPPSQDTFIFAYDETIELLNLVKNIIV